MSLPGAATEASGTAAHSAATAVWNLAEDTVYWSPAVFRLLGHDPALGPLTLDQLPGRLVPRDRPVLCRMVTAALVHGRPLDGTVRVARAGGGASVHCSGRPELDPDGQVVSLRLRLRAC
ncbi:PAS domain-containing protein [Kitasatospora sp. NPDC052896]|uniref:PAS domain-containing protein n=1 Tax=Kitasatospora sp. NPDC052896 TaxID=3364061 RepID=UPI0037C7B3DB